jgi:general secretion pathway protein G
MWSRHIQTPPHRSDRGFTLVELLVVLTILALIVGLVAPRALGYLGRGKTEAARIDIRTLGSALDLFRLDLTRFPTQAEGLQALITQPPGLTGWAGPYLPEKSMPTDPWGRPYIYRIPGQHGPYDLFSLGADNAPGGTGEDQDVASWQDATSR